MNGEKYIGRNEEGRVEGWETRSVAKGQWDSNHYC